MKKLVILLIAASVGYLHQESVLRSMPATPPSADQIIQISASTFEFTPSEIVVRKDVPVTLELVSPDRHHGFKLTAFGLRADIHPGVVQKIRFIPDKTGTFTFFCDVFCGSGHEEMSGTLKVVEQ
jgi:cytochrome c oxidase subunit 2